MNTQRAVDGEWPGQTLVVMVIVSVIFKWTLGNPNHCCKNIQCKTKTDSYAEPNPNVSIMISYMSLHCWCLQKTQSVTSGVGAQCRRVLNVFSYIKAQVVFMASDAGCLMFPVTVHDEIFSFVVPLLWHLYKIAESGKKRIMNIIKRLCFQAVYSWRGRFAFCVLNWFWCFRITHLCPNKAPYLRLPSFVDVWWLTSSMSGSQLASKVCAEHQSWPLACW